MERIYFPGLNGLRFIAASAVIVSHVEELKSVFGVRSGAEGPLRIYTVIGDLAVTFFFVLSGFLITYLLLYEKKGTGSISLKKFYLRRVFRIFPLYYLIVLVGLFVLPNFEGLYIPEWSDKLHDHFWPKAMMYLTFFSNLTAVSTYPIPYVSPAWSIGVEEQFYLVWPILMLYFKKSLRVMLIVILVYLLMAKGMAILVDNQLLYGRFFKIISDFLFLTRMDCMAIGGLAAYLFFVKTPRLLDIIYHRVFQWLLYSAVVMLTFFGVEFGYFTHEIYALFFACIILNVATNQRSLLKPEHPTLRYLGNISYGIYMYHFLCIRIALNLAWNVQGKEQPLGTMGNAILYSGSLLLSILMAAISYQLFERYFIRLKKQAAVVESGMDT